MVSVQYSQLTIHNSQTARFKYGLNIEPGMVWKHH